MPKIKYALRQGIGKITPQNIVKLCLVFVIVPLAVINISSYVIASWVMRPIGDDYVWLPTFTIHQSNWLGVIWHYLMTANGRYAQNIASIVPYSIFGSKFMRIAGILVLMVIFWVSYQVIKYVAARFRVKMTTTERISLVCILFFLYTTLSFIFPGTRGHLDNTFQNILFYPAVVTYTVPLCLLIGLILLIYKYPRAAVTKVGLSFTVGAGIVIGLFNESVPLIYCTALAVIGSYVLLVTRKNVLAFLKRHIGLIAAAIGQVLGVIIIYTSPACRARRILVDQTDHVHHSGIAVLKIAIKATERLMDQYFNSVVVQHSIILVMVIAVVVGLYAISRFKPKLRCIRITALHILAISGIMYILSVFASRLVLIIGYGEDQVTPRLEILYNGWLVLFIVAIGLLIASFIVAVIHGRLYLPAMIILATILLLCIPHSLNQIANRLTVVTAFSKKWDAQNSYLLQAAAHNKQRVTVPVIDIGDGYSINCKTHEDGNWLGLAKEQYYNIPRICAK
jgi:hypothetical protein